MTASPTPRAWRTRPRGRASWPPERSSRRDLRPVLDRDPVRRADGRRLGDHHRQRRGGRGHHAADTDGSLRPAPAAARPAHVAPSARFARWAGEDDAPAARGRRAARSSSSCRDAVRRPAPRPARRRQRRAGSTTRVAYDRLAEGFGPGFNGPLVLASSRRPTAPSRAALERIPPPSRDAGRGRRLAAPALAAARRRRLTVIPRARRRTSDHRAGLPPARRRASGAPGESRSTSTSAARPRRCRTSPTGSPSGCRSSSRSSSGSACCC